MNNDLLSKLFVAMFTDNENERNVACNKLVLECTRRGLHPVDIKLLYGNNLLERQHRQLETLTEHRDKLTEENNALRREIELFRSYASPQIKRRVREKLAPPKHSKIFSDLVLEKLFAGKGSSRNRYPQVAQFLDVSEGDVKLWQKSNAIVPEWVLDKLRSATPLPISIRPKKRGKSKKKQPTSKTVEGDITAIFQDTMQDSFL